MSRRAGGRLARKSMRAAPLSEEMRPVRPGLEGGSYRPLDAAAVAAIDDTVFQILEEIGLSQAPESGIAYMTSVGAIAGDDGRVRFPRAVVEDTLAKAARNITLHGQSAEHDLHLSGKKVHYGTAGAAVHLVDVAGNAYRESVLQDIYDAARIVEKMDNIHFFQRPMVARDVPDARDLDLNTLYASVKGTSNMSVQALPRLNTSLRRSTCCTRLPAAKMPGGPGLSFPIQIVLLSRLCGLPLKAVL